MVQSLIWSVTLYRAETWTMRKEDVKRIEACEMWIWRGMEGISWTEHRTNEEVLKKVEEKRSLMDIHVSRTRQKNWIGHILRGNYLQREIMEGRMEGKRGRGRPRQKFMDWMMEGGYWKLKEKAQHREEWSRWTFGPENTCGIFYCRAVCNVFKIYSLGQKSNLIERLTCHVRLQ